VEKQKIEKFNKVFPWFAGLSSDLLFWVAIDTLFLTVVKNFSASQIVSLTTVSLITCIALQMPILKIIKKIGNTKSVQFGSFIVLISSILITFGPNYLIVVLGRALVEVGWTFQNMANVILKNNLEMQQKGEEYVKVKTKGNTIYAIVTMLISFVASPMFNLNNYLPMICCILFCLACFLLSYNIVDFSNYDKAAESTKNKSTRKIKYSKTIVILLISYGLFFAVVNSGQANGKLFIQQELMLNFNVENTALLIGIILSLSRIIRVISNILFGKIYEKYKDKVGVALTVLLCMSISFMILGFFVKNSIVLQFSIMSLGYIIILFVRDQFKVYMQDLGLKNSEKENQKTLLTTMELSRKVIRTIISLSFTVILLDNPMITVITILCILSVIEIIISIKLYKLVSKSGDTNI